MAESDSTIPAGYCQCGCGQRTKIARRTVNRLGRVKGQPVRYIQGHSGRWEQEQKLRREQGLKRCSQCKNMLPSDQFSSIVKRRRKDGTEAIVLRGHCDDCERKRAARWRDSNRTAFRRQMKDCNLQKLYGITLAEYERMLELQGGRCAICRGEEIRIGKSGRTKTLSVDHDHDTGRVRGLLCHKCNSALGCLRESVELFEAAIAYLRQHK